MRPYLFVLTLPFLIGVLALSARQDTAVTAVTQAAEHAHSMPVVSIGEVFRHL
ncbi:hypothetical protein M2318_001883 [Metapseudomonas resinovorans]|uniref:hypothetical protein n=1 Tax=Metapseudomonas resinovorans TaxID=53412 RepID=UPI003D1EE058